jgi:hypothetical protein
MLFLFCLLSKLNNGWILTLFFNLLYFKRVYITYISKPNFAYDCIVSVAKAKEYLYLDNLSISKDNNSCKQKFHKTNLF